MDVNDLISKLLSKKTILIFLEKFTLKNCKFSEWTLLKWRENVLYRWNIEIALILQMPINHQQAQKFKVEKNKHYHSIKKYISNQKIENMRPRCTVIYLRVSGTKLTELYVL